MIRGVGIDLTPIDRIATMLDRWGARFEEKLFTDGERAYCRARANAAQHYAARFAAKEAALKALAVPPGLEWHDLEVVSEGGAPTLRLSGGAARAADALGATRSHLTLTHAAGVAAAVVILEG